jgi:Fe-S cluster assembly protein SufD
VATSTATYAEAAAVEAARGRGEPDWLVNARAEAARAFAVTSMPAPSLRPWKYTDVTALDIETFAPDAAFAPRVTGTAPAGGFAGTLAAGLATHGEVIHTHLGSVIPGTEGKFTAANAALWRDGVLVYAQRGKAFDAPVTVHVEGREGAIFPRILIVAEAASEVSIILRTSSPAAPLLVAGVIEVVAQADSRVRLLIDTRWGAATQEFSTLRAKIGRGADVQVGTIALGGLIVKHTVEALMEGEGSSSSIRGVAVGDMEQHFDFVTLQELIGPKSTSEVEIKTALAGASRSIYYGLTRVETTAVGASANQENRNLLLSPRAKADADPVLEILTNEVIRCGHGATVGPVDKDALFYLQSRGLDMRQSLTLLVTGFFQSVLSGLDAPGLVEELETALREKLATAELT